MGVIKSNAKNSIYDTTMTISQWIWHESLEYKYDKKKIPGWDIANLFYIWVHLLTQVYRPIDDRAQWDQYRIDKRLIIHGAHDPWWDKCSAMQLLHSWPSKHTLIYCVAFFCEVSGRHIIIKHRIVQYLKKKCV